MISNNYIRCIHRKPPYKMLKNPCGCSFRHKEYTNYYTSMPMQKANGNGVFAVPTAPEHGGTNPQAAAAINVAQAMSSANRQGIQEASGSENISGADSTASGNAAPVPPVLYAGGAPQTPDTPQTTVQLPETILELFQRDTRAIVSELEKPVQMLVDATDRIASGVTQLAEMASRQKRIKAAAGGLLRFREWWELVEVTICAGGKLISGTPIFIEEDVLRVITGDHSYFIPLDKIDFIRSGDGLHTGFSHVENMPAP